MHDYLDFVSAGRDFFVRRGNISDTIVVDWEKDKVVVNFDVARAGHDRFWRLLMLPFQDSQEFHHSQLLRGGMAHRNETKKRGHGLIDTAKVCRGVWL